jgi:hypothetical protein
VECVLINIQYGQIFRAKSYRVFEISRARVRASPVVSASDKLPGPRNRDPSPVYRVTAKTALCTHVRVRGLRTPTKLERVPLGHLGVAS